jgi:hypothetical protein
MISRSKIKKADLVGISSSLICLIHCISLPIIVGFGATIFMSPIVDYIFLIISLGSIYKSTQRNESVSISIFLWVSFVGFLVTIMFLDDYTFSNLLEYLFAFLLIVGHLLSIKFSLKCEHEH